MRDGEGEEAALRRGPSASGNELLSAFVNDDQGVYRADVARVNQPFSLDVRRRRLEGADVLGVEFEDLWKQIGGQVEVAPKKRTPS